VVDLTNPINVELFRRWKRDDSAYLDILRYVRISSEDPEKLVVSRSGKHQNLKNQDKADMIALPISMGTFQISNIIQGIDDIP
jgi:translation machinery-associated protein 16